MSRKWTKEEDFFLKDTWGNYSYSVLSNRLKRSKSAIVARANKLGLGPLLMGGEYITFNQIRTVLGLCGGGYTFKDYVNKYNFPIKTKVVNKKRFRIVYLDDFWKWAENNKTIVDFSRLEENALGKEPEWVKGKRKEDFKRFNLVPKKKDWSEAEDQKLIHLLKKYKYTYTDLTNILGRTSGSIQNRILYLGLMERPIEMKKAKWTDEEIERLKELIINGDDYVRITQKFPYRSEQSIRSTCYRLYKTKELNVVRKLIMEEKK